MMPKKLTQEEFLDRLHTKYPDKFITDSVKYVVSTEKVLVGCPKCGHEWSVTPNNLLNGSGCPQCKASKTSHIHTTHGHSRNREDSRTYNSWRAMKERCQNPNNVGYLLYGGRGIVVCEKWQQFEGFLEDMGERPEGMTLDRIDPNGNYDRLNCRWASASDQARNKTNFTIITYNGVDKTVREWADDFGLPRRTLSRRLLNLGWAVEKALLTPVGE